MLVSLLCSSSTAHSYRVQRLFHISNNLNIIYLLVIYIFIFVSIMECTNKNDRFKQVNSINLYLTLYIKN